MQELRERGIYTLPSAGNFVAHAVFRGGYVLYKPADWEFFGPYAYESDGTGKIHGAGRPTPWDINDLTDTNSTARSRSRNGAAQKSSMGE